MLNRGNFKVLMGVFPSMFQRQENQLSVIDKKSILFVLLIGKSWENGKPAPCFPLVHFFANGKSILIDLWPFNRGCRY